MNQSKLQTWLKLLRPYLTPVFGGALALVLMDLWLSKPELRDPRSDLLPVLPINKVAPQPGSNDVVQQLINQLEQPDVTEREAEDNKDKGLSLEQQQQQQGLLKELYIGDNVYRLTAIVRQGGRHKAVLSVRSVQAEQGAKAERLELNAGDEIKGYQVSELSAKRLTLTQKERRVWLELFVPVLLSGSADTQPKPN
ncbi:hypothetical protein ACFO3I_17670 [Rheinheimera marina]|uniref:Type II secretion system protein GspC N-terminal domain-containing protein n=1 Tax=Rheinheimera marina TaxID=1774958 RepID=A0ABV9JRG9_9GAMM